MKQENKDNLYLRVYVSGGGCSGLSYGMGFEEKVDEDDAVINKNGVQVIVDSYSQKYLKGANIDYIESLMGSGFKINNPNVTKSLFMWPFIFNRVIRYRQTLKLKKCSK